MIIDTDKEKKKCLRFGKYMFITHHHYRNLSYYSYSSWKMSVSSDADIENYGASELDYISTTKDSISIQNIRINPHLPLKAHDITLDQEVQSQSKSLLEPMWSRASRRPSVTKEVWQGIQSTSHQSSSYTLWFLLSQQASLFLCCFYDGQTGAMRASLKHMLGSWQGSWRIYIQYVWNLCHHVLKTSPR